MLRPRAQPSREGVPKLACILLSPAHGGETIPGAGEAGSERGAFMDIKPYGHQLAQSASQNRALATLSDSDDKQSGWSQQVSLSSQVLTGKAQQALTYEHLARNGKNTVLTGGVKDARVQQMVDKALGFDRKKFDDLERQLKGIADDKTLSAEERETQSKDLAAQRDAMLKEAMDRLTGKSASQA